MPFHFCRYHLLLTFILSLTIPLAAQGDHSPYHLSLKRDLLLGGGGVGTVILGNYLRNQVPEVTLGELELGNVPSFDRFAINYNSASAKSASNRTRDISSLMPALLLLGKASRKDAPKLLLLYAETVALRRGLTNIVKYTARRPRPYLRTEGLDPETIVQSGDRRLFYQDILRLQRLLLSSSAGCLPTIILIAS